MPHAADGHGPGRVTSEATTSDRAATSGRAASKAASRTGSRSGNRAAGEAAGGDTGPLSTAGSHAEDTAATDSRPGRVGRERPHLSSQAQRGATGRERGAGRERGETGRERPAELLREWREAARRATSRFTDGRSDHGRDHDREDEHGGGHGSGHGSGHGVGRRSAGGEAAVEEPTAVRQRPRGRPYSRSLEMHVDWARAGVFGAGLTIGALIGAGVALLTAPQSGTRTRRQIAAVGRRAGSRAADAWGDLGDDLRVVRAKTRRDLRRRVRSGRRDAVDAWSDLDRRALRGLRNIRDWRAERAGRSARERVHAHSGRG